MATFSELASAANSAPLVERIRIATLVVANNIRIEPAGTPDHLVRMRWAARLFNAPEVESLKIVWPVLVMNRAFPYQAIIDAPDDALIIAVNDAVIMMGA